MSLLLVIAVALAVFLYVRATKQARRQWLNRLDLPGRWHGEAGGDEAWTLTLHGAVDGGEFILASGASDWRGHWRLVGHTFKLEGAGRVQEFDLHFFKAGSIGLEDETGRRRVLTKVTDNVVPLRSQSGQ